MGVGGSHVDGCNGCHLPLSIEDADMRQVQAVQRHLQSGACIDNVPMRGWVIGFGLKGNKMGTIV